MNNNQKPKIWAIIPAGGVGKRMQTALAKQYLLLNDKTIIEHSITAFLLNKSIAGIAVVVQSDDKNWNQNQLKINKPFFIAEGGKERSDSVLSGLNYLVQQEKFNLKNDWVMVHDAVRPCLTQQDIDKLINQVDFDINGGLLAIPVRDTLKQATKSRKSTTETVTTTISRENIYQLDY